jgi:hypothetical protein
MAKLINQGWSKRGDEIRQPIGVVLGGDLKANSKPSSPPPKGEDGQDEPQDQRK